MKKVTIVFIIAGIMLFACSSNTEQPGTGLTETSEEAIKALKIENLLRETLELADSIEIVMSYLEIPKNTTLPTHYHPGEEFVYMLEGSGELLLDGATKINAKAGDVVKVPLREIHSFTTFDKAVKAVVFRVHEQGQPDRILVE